MSDAERAYELAQEKIAEAAREGAFMLNLSGKALQALDRLPEEIADLAGLELINANDSAINDLTPLAGLTKLSDLDLGTTKITDLTPLGGLKRLRNLDLDNTEITDLTPLAALQGLESLDLNSTKISDISPLAAHKTLEILDLSNTKITNIGPVVALRRLETLYLRNTLIDELSPIASLTSLRNLYIDNTRVSDLRPVTVAMGETLNIFEQRDFSFSQTPATKKDAKLAALAKLEDDQQRTRETLAYLRSLPPWPEPYTPAATPDGSPPQPIGGRPVAPEIKAAQSHIRFLMRNAALTRVSARQFADQIDDALRGVPATNRNELAEPLQTMAEMADTLRHLADTNAPVDTPIDHAKLEARIAELEAQVRKLTAQLSDETKAREAAEALAGKQGYWQSFKQSAGKASGVAVVSLATVGAPTAAVYFLGVDHPFVRGFLTVLGRLPNS